MEPVTFVEAAETATLHGQIGKKAIKPEYRRQISIDENIRPTGSVDLDRHFRDAEPNAGRWDHGICVNDGTEHAIWIETHKAGNPVEVDVVLKKLEWLKSKLRSPDHARLSRLTESAGKSGRGPFFLGVQGKSGFRAGGKTQARPARAGMTLPVRIPEID